MKYCILFILSSSLFTVSVVNSQPLYIAYTGNLNGVLEACNCEGNDRGGMTQLANAVDSLKLMHPDLIFLDSGDFLKSFSLPEANRLMFDFMCQLQYSVIALGEQEFVEGEEYLFMHLTLFPIHLVCSNLIFPLSRADMAVPYIIVNSGNHRVGILSVLNPECFDYIKMPALEFMDVNQSINQYIKLLKAETDLIILICHGDFRTGQQLGMKFPEIQVIITGHSQEKMELIGNRQVILQPGYDGEFIGFLTVNFAEQGLSFENQFLPVDQRQGIYKPFKDKIDRYYQEIKDPNY